MMENWSLEHGIVNGLSKIQILMLMALKVLFSPPSADTSIKKKFNIDENILQGVFDIFGAKSQDTK
jgi:hypothetical protein